MLRHPGPDRRRNPNNRRRGGTSSRNRPDRGVLLRGPREAVVSKLDLRAEVGSRIPVLAPGPLDIRLHGLLRGLHDFGDLANSATGCVQHQGALLALAEPGQHLGVGASDGVTEWSVLMLLPGGRGANGRDEFVCGLGLRNEGERAGLNGRIDRRDVGMPADHDGAAARGGERPDLGADRDAVIEIEIEHDDVDRERAVGEEAGPARFAGHDLDVELRRRQVRDYTVEDESMVVNDGHPDLRGSGWAAGHHGRSPNTDFAPRVTALLSDRSVYTRSAYPI